MRTVAISVHNNQELEIFVRERKGAFELWAVGPSTHGRTVLDHYLTHDDLEGRLYYQRRGDLVWREASASEILARKHENAIQTEETIKQGVFWDCGSRRLKAIEDTAQQALGGLSHVRSQGSRVRPRPSVAAHLSAIALLRADRNALTAAKNALVGRWTDGVVTLTIEPHNRLRWSCTYRRHPLNVWQHVHGHAPDRWNFALWRLHLMSREHKCGTHLGVLRVDTDELHLEGDKRDQIAKVLRRE
jgi:hypothetical protein